MRSSSANEQMAPRGAICTSSCQNQNRVLTGVYERICTVANKWYAIAKIAGLKLCEAYRRQYGCDFISAQPTNLYGPFDNFDLQASHVLPALMRKAHEAKLAGADTLSVWGSGSPLREFLHVDDLADALTFLARAYSDAQFVNVGSGQEVSIAELAHLVADAVGFDGRLEFDASKPDGTPRKLVDTSRLQALGWRPSIALRDGIPEVYRWFLGNGDNLRQGHVAA